MSEVLPVREAAEELALLWGTFILGRWSEVMASDNEPADDWEEEAAAEAVALFLPALQAMLAGVWDRGYGSGVGAPANRALGLGNPVNPYRTPPTGAPS